MKHLKWILILCLNLMILYCSSENNSNRIIRAMTFNIRLNVDSDSLNAWPYRKEMAASMIRFHHADIIGIQEALKKQVDDLAERLPDYSWFGIGRDDGDKQGEFMAIFYLKNRFKVLDHSTFWLSEHPKLPGKGWDAACNRIVTWGKFEDIRTDNSFYHFNTHFDHLGDIARKESAKLLLKQIITIAGNSDVIVTGDFNSTPNSVPYKILTQKSEGETELNLFDAKMVSDNPHHGPNGTFTGFKLSNLIDHNQPIDYIFVTKKIKVLNHGTLSDTFDGFFPSDHMPVLAEIRIE
ncbi:endonuclease/exonuclease/phosphatase family protein [bacterium]